ncbi:hypothetical protein M0R45_005705 [Rubus argutus]|uniref:NAC domain-containing protein n=1 Tax=Rubus argutus TaxID=59490 RepID=A0AAW1YNQ8_RUBAR
MKAELELPAGFRFHPTDEELVNHYLIKKCASQNISVPIIKEIDLYKFDPWQLPDMALYGEKEWYFFSPRDRKYPNGSRPNRAAGTGSATKKNHNLRLDDWVLCRIYNKKGSIEKHNMGSTDRNRMSTYSEIMDHEQKPELINTQMPSAPSQMPSAVPVAQPQHMDMLSGDYSVPRLQHTTDYSSSSEHVLSPEVQSEFQWSSPELDNSLNLNFLDNNDQFNYMDGFSLADIDDPFGTQAQAQGRAQFQMDQQDLFMYLQNQI